MTQREPWADYEMMLKKQEEGEEGKEVKKWWRRRRRRRRRGGGGGGREYSWEVGVKNKREKLRSVEEERDVEQMGRVNASVVWEVVSSTFCESEFMLGPPWVFICE